MKKKFRTRNGITLVALIVTIIILLILAGVTLNLVSGSNGILGKATKAAEVTKLAAIKEQMQLDLVTAQADSIIDGELNISQAKLTEIIKKYGELQEDGDTIVTESGNISLKEIYQNANSGGGETGGSETGGDVTIDSEEISKLNSEMQSLKAEVNALKTANNSMKTSITALSDSLSPTSYQKPTMLTGANWRLGGFYQIGKTVYVLMNFDVDENVLPLSKECGNRYASYTAVAEGFPIPNRDAAFNFVYSSHDTTGGNNFEARGSTGVDQDGKLYVTKNGHDEYYNKTGVTVYGTYLAK